MSYNLFLYSTTAVRKEAIAIDLVNRNLRSNFPESDKGNRPEEGMKVFDTSRVAELIRSELDTTVKGGFEISERHSPERKIGYICVEARIDAVDSLWPGLVKIALQEELVLLDAQVNKYEYEPFAIRFAWRNMKRRIRTLTEQIMLNTEAVWNLRKLYKKTNNGIPEAAYVLTLNRSRDHSLDERISAFAKLITSLLQNNEKLDCRFQCFTIVGEWYSIAYTLEAYYKNPDKICYLADGSPTVDVLHRISCEKAFQWIRRNTVKNRELYYGIVERVFFLEMVGKYPNPADRFCASLNITKMLLKETLPVRYGSYRYYGDDIMFHRVPYGHPSLQDNCRDDVSAIKIQEELATFILPYVDEQYPYFHKRYYLTDNHIPPEMLEKIKNKLVDARTALYSGTNLEALVPYLNDANFFVFGEALHSHEADDRHHQTRELIGRYRLSIARLYDLFVKWAEMQLKYGDEDDLYNIIGP